MTFQAQEANGRFIAWGKKKAKDNSYIVEENKPFTAKVLDIRESDKYGYIFELKTKDCDDVLIAPGNTNLRRLMGYEVDENGELKEKQSVKKSVEVGDTIRITFLGMVKGKRGKEAYTYKLEVDR